MRDEHVDRRNALRRLLALPAVALTGSVVPPVAEAGPALPEWLDGPPGFATGVERIARALAACEREDQAELLDLMGRLAERVRDFPSSRVQPPPPPRPKPPTPPARRIVDERRVVTVRLGKLAPNERRRLRRWAARLPSGREQPIVRVRAGQYRDERGYDFLHVAAPELSEGSPYTYAAQIVHEAAAIVGPFDHTLVCEHMSPDQPGALGVIVV